MCQNNLMEYKDCLNKLKNSKFRNSFHLKNKDFAYIERVGMEKIESHAYDFVNARLAPKIIPNDGKQTPMRGHPVFIAQHATATCCRGCLWKWWKIPQNKDLSPDEIEFVVGLILEWIKSECERFNQSQNA